MNREVQERCDAEEVCGVNAKACAFQEMGLLADDPWKAVVDTQLLELDEVC